MINDIVSYPLNESFNKDKLVEYLELCKKLHYKGENK